MNAQAEADAEVERLLLIKCVYAAAIVEIVVEARFGIDAEEVAELIGSTQTSAQ